MALCGFYVLARLELGSVVPLCVPGLAIGAVAAGLALGAFLFGRIRSREAVRWGATAAAVLLWLFWLAVPMGATQADLPLAVAGVALLVCSGAWRRRAFVAGGLICGAVVIAVGLPGVLGLGPLVAAGLAAVIGSGLADRSRVSEYPAAGRWTPAPRLLLAAALGAAGAMLLRNYLPVTRSLPYAGAELTAAFALGWLLRPGVLRGPFSSPAAGLVAACGIAFVAAFSGGSFWLFPDLVWTGSGAMQLPAEMLSAGRAFPVWLLAFGLGVVSGPALDEPFVGALPAVAAGAVASGLLGASYAAPLLLSLGLCLGCSGVVALWQARGGGRRVLRWGGAALLAGLLVWVAAGDMWAGYPELRRRLGRVSVRVERAESHGRGRTVVLYNAQDRWEFLNGALVSASDEAAGDLRLLVALALSYGEAPETVGVQGPALAETARGAGLLAEGARVAPVSGDARFDAIIAGPGPLCGAGNPMRFRFLEALQGLRARLSRDGVLAMWIPVGAGGLTGLRRHLATFQEVFPRFHLYVRGGGAVLVAGGGRRLNYGRLARLFRGPGAGWLESGGYWEPIEVLSDFVAEGEQVSGLIRDAAPYRWSWPGRPPGLARDLARAPDIVSAAALLQYRAVGPGRLPGRIEFAGDRERLISLRGFAAFYRGRSRDRLRRLGQGYPTQRGALVEFVESPFARRDLLVGEQKAGPTAAARALRVFGLHDDAIEVLERRVQGRGDSFEARKELVEALADAQRPAEALPHCRRAVEMRPDSAEMSRRLAALLLATNQHREAAETLEGMIARGIHGNLDVLMLARLRLQAKGYADAARLAQRVLDNDPDNTQARLLLQMAMGQTRGGT